MYRVDRNNFYTNQKKATVYTPSSASRFLYSILKEHIKGGLILDPCVGRGALLKPFMEGGYRVLGIDIEEQGFSPTMKRNWLAIQRGELSPPALIIMNPPFNIDEKTKAYIKTHYGGRPLLPEIWLMKAIELFGTHTPIVMFTPYGFRLNQTTESARWRKFIDGTYPDITSIISLPKNLFENILFHSEVLVFNIYGMKGHYFYCVGGAV